MRFVSPTNFRGRLVLFEVFLVHAEGGELSSKPPCPSSISYRAPRVVARGRARVRVGDGVWVEYGLGYRLG